ncbi:S-layer homology domain-containing protein [Paenibacillus glycanilyticus]|uniref:S-layer homology domain-containing protein n=1 Tax=Paenibacillus glycanilyticus TaxID=126569 RepID=UPI00295F4004|nr:S-layer homology domain-containing protein [Paenibacillus glycanilyticus]
MKVKLKAKWKGLTLALFVCTVLFTIGAYNVSAESTIIKGPYLLFEGQNSSMSVMWQTSDNQPNTIKWGTDTSYSLGEQSVETYGNDNQHKYTITGLQPGTKYYYEVEGQAGSFVAAPADDATSVKFLSYGDSRTQPAFQDQVADLARKAYAEDPAYQSILLNSGDIASSDSESNWTAQYFVPESSYPQMHALQTEVPMMGARGNHEGVGSVYEKYYPYPYVNDFYWSFDYGPVHVSVIDEYADFKEGSAQYNWLENDLATTDKPWKIVMGHQPAWGAGTHENNTDVQKYIHPLLKKFGVPLYLNGHNHNYARAEVDGIEYLTSGGGGAPSYDVDPSWPNIVKADKSYFLTLFDVQGDTMKVTSKRIDGTEIETITVHNTPQAALDIAKATLTADKDTLQTDVSDSSVKLGLTAVDSKDANVDLSNVNLSYKTDKPDLVTITSDGTVTVKKKPVFNEAVQVWSEIYNAGEIVKSNTVTINVKNPDGLAEVTLASDHDTLTGDASSSAKLSLTAKDNLGAAMDLSSAEVKYTSSADDIVAISADGIVTVKNKPPRATSVSIEAEVTVQGKTVNSNKISILVGSLPNGNSHLLVSPIKSPYDDMEEKADGTLDMDSSDLEIVVEDSVQQIGLRFAGLNLPKGAKITDAYVQFSVDEPGKNSDPFDVNIYAEAVANSLPDKPGNISSRVKSDNFVSWKDIAQWTVEHESGPNQQTPNLASLVQQIVNMDDWKEGNAMTFLLTGKGTRTAESFEGAGSNADQVAHLYVVYTIEGTDDGGGTPGGGTPGGGTPGGGTPGGTPNNGGTSGNGGTGNGGNPVIPANPFKDVDSHYEWAKDAIAVLADKGIINGTTSTTFEPGKQITRADFMEMLVRMLDLKADVTSNFSDVKSSDYYYHALGVVKALGIANGTGDNEFNPRAYISRQDMMVLMSRAMEVTGKLAMNGDAAELNGFKDKSKLAPYAVDAAADMVKAGIVQGSASALNPTGQATRAETAQMIYRLYLLLQK